MQQPGSPSRTIGWMGLSLVALPGGRGSVVDEKKGGEGEVETGPVVSQRAD